MSDDDRSYTSVLLPSARVTLFTRDAETRAAFEAIRQDWRFARVTLDVVEGGVNDAINTYTSYASPDLVIIQTEEIADGFTDRLEALGGVCNEGTAAIIIGPVNDVNLYRRLVNLGISDYLVKPIRTEHLGNDIAATLLKKIGATGSRLIALMGGKGGVGVTAISETLAWATSDMLGQKTFLLDASGGWSTLSVGIGFEPAATLAEAARAAVEKNEDSLGRMIHEASDKLFVLSSGSDVMLEDNVPPEHYETLLNYLMGIYPVVIVDLSQSPSALRRVVLTKANRIVMVTTPTLPAVRATRTLLQELKDLRGGASDEAEIVVNMQGYSAKNEVSKSQIEQGLERRVAVVIPFETDLFVTVESQGKKLHEDKEGVLIAEKLLRIVRDVISGAGSDGTKTEDDKKSGKLSGLLTKLKAKG
ncbi:MAG: AAA family ATPase [Micavibrio aeruginosavorus]|uniref:AAA family ATPase n=1 Tax=Micavibrio aeruginosavorus TaxID=349221 RepID=A0A7T5R3T2_9BACT|nr:MAG: AAA family ATPase [Micavibrio aeruginosavorus]